MQETNQYRQPRDPERVRRAKAAHRAKMRKRKQRQQLAALIGLILFLALVIFAVANIIGHITGGNATQTTPVTTEVTTEPTEPPTEPPTLPPMTWMNFAENRQILARDYFVYSVENEAFLTISGQPDDLVYPASVTKLFSIYVAMQYVSPETMVTATDALDLVAEGSSIADIRWGETVSVERLLEGMLLPSGNDAACILAVEVGRIIANDPSLGAVAAKDVFVEEMNRQAQLLGMEGTHFSNADGFHHEAHYTTIEDLALIGKLALQNPTIMKYGILAEDTYTPENGIEKVWKNTNLIINPDSKYYCPYALGLKTGKTSQAGACLMSAFRCNDQTLIIGVFGCPENNDRFPDTLQLFNEAMGFEPLPPEPSVTEAPSEFVP